MYNEDLALNDLQWLICQKTLTNQFKFSPSPMIPALGKEGLKMFARRLLLSRFSADKNVHIC